MRRVFYDIKTFLAGLATNLIAEASEESGVTIDGLLLKDGNTIKSTSMSFHGGTGAPSGATINGVTVNTAAMYIRINPADADTVLYVTHNGGTNWTAVKATAG